MSFLDFLFRRKKASIYGSAEWMTPKEIKKEFNPKKNEGLWLGSYRMSLEESYKNLALVAPTGSGKSTRFVIKNLLLVKQESSIVVTDPSGELYRKTFEHMKKRGFNIKVLDPSDIKKSSKFNPCERFNTPSTIKQLATILGSQNSKNEADFWTTNGIAIIYMALLVLFFKDKEENTKIFTIEGARDLIISYGVDGGVFQEQAIKYLPEKYFKEFKAFTCQESTVIQNILSTAKVALDLWTDENVCELTNENTINIEDLRDKNTIIYLICDEAKIKYYSIIFNLFYSACFGYLLANYNEDSRPVFFLLDEFANIGKILDFETTSTTLRKRKCSLSLILQDLSQLNLVYGEDRAKTIINGGVASRLFFGGCGLETTEYVERMLGASTETEKIAQGGEKDDRFLISSKALLTKDQIRMLPKTKALFFSGNLKPMNFEMLPYWEDRDLKKFKNITK